MWVGLAEKQISADGKLGRLPEFSELLKHTVGYPRFIGALLQHDFFLWAPAKDVRLAEKNQKYCVRTVSLRTQAWKRNPKGSNIATFHATARPHQGIHDERRC